MPKSCSASPDLRAGRAVGRATGFALVALAHLAALAAAALVLRFATGLHPLAALAVADLTATAVVFAASRLADNSSVYDPYWSVAPIVIAVYLAFVHGGEVPWRLILVLLVVATWGLRLTWNWARDWPGLAHEDWRYRDFRARFPRGYWGVSFAGIHLVPTVVVFLGCLPLWPAVSGAAPLGGWDGLAALVAVGAILFETVADEQLRAHRRHAPAGNILRRGVWTFSRHPNYLGEILFWWGLGLFGLAAVPAALWVLVGPVAMVALFCGVSVPMLDRRSLARRPCYAAHMRDVAALLPWPRRR